ncbi:cytochrome P450 [archaeon]|nr:MAG: cytochrome P450 [archaeon]
MEEAFLAFGSGPRVCPGMSLAILESVLAIAYIVKNFSIELACDPKDIVREMNITSNPNMMIISLTEL